MNRITIPLTLAAWLWASSTNLLLAEGPYVSPDKVTNAALVYWQAFSFLPDLSSEQTELLRDLAEYQAPLEEAEPILASGQRAIAFTKYVQPTMPCQWELIEAGPGTLLPHLGKARLLARLLILQARTDAAADQHNAAIRCLSSALLLSRNIDDGVLVEMLVANSIDSQATKTSKLLLLKLKHEAAKTMQQSFSALPARAQFGQAIQHERDVFANWMRPIIAADTDEATKMLGESVGIEAMPILGGSKEERKKWFDELLSQYDQVINASKLPPTEASQQFSKLEAEVGKASNPMIRLLMPSFGRAYENHRRIADQFTALQKSLEETIQSSPSNTN